MFHPQHSERHRTLELIDLPAEQSDRFVDSEPEQQVATSAACRPGLRGRAGPGALGLVLVLVLSAAAMRLGSGPDRVADRVREPVLPGMVGVCGQRLTTCRGEHTFTLGLRVPVTWTLPSGFAPNVGGGPTRLKVGTYTSRRGHPAGVTVLERVHAAELGPRPQKLPGRASAQEFATWVANRPFLAASSVRETRVDGRRAWTVDVVPRRGLPPGPATCSQTFACYPVTYQRARSVELTGVWAGMRSRYSVLDLPGAGVTVVWSWVFAGDDSGLAANEKVVRALHFG